MPPLGPSVNMRAAPNELRSAGPRAALPVTMWNGLRGLRCNAWLGDALILKHHHTVLPRSLVHGAAFGLLALRSFCPLPLDSDPLQRPRRRRGGTPRHN